MFLREVFIKTKPSQKEFVKTICLKVLRDAVREPINILNNTKEQHSNVLYNIFLSFSEKLGGEIQPTSDDCPRTEQLIDF